MRIVTMQAKVDPDKCEGCRTCERVCPTESIRVGEDFIAEVNEVTCAGCGNCQDRCPNYAVELIALKEPRVLGLDWTTADHEQVAQLCRKAHMNPQEMVCFCAGTRAREVAASILLGARTPEEISRQTGIRTGCTVECIQPILRLLTAANIELDKAPGYQWYGLTPTLWDLPEKVTGNPEFKKFCFSEDRKLMEKIVEAGGK